MKTADSKISAVIHLKHTVEQSDALRQALALSNTDNTLFKHYHMVSKLFDADTAQPVK